MNVTGSNSESRGATSLPQAGLAGGESHALGTALSPGRGQIQPGLLVPDFEYQHRHYLARFARSSSDIDAVCRLRYDVFNLELGEGLEQSRATRRDRDEYDDQCQHLMVLDTKKNQVVGTYRMQVRESAEAGVGFYSASEFDFSSIPGELLDGTVELGRACTDRKHRKRAVLDMLWRGLAVYLQHNRRRYFCGCSSLTSQDPALGLATYKYLHLRGYTHPSLNVLPLPSYECVSPGPCKTRVKIPKLFKLYLRQGAKICGPPAIDRFFGTVDFLTLIDTKLMDQAFFRSYSR